jgi:hypothetical protein
MFIRFYLASKSFSSVPIIYHCVIRKSELYLDTQLLVHNNHFTIKEFCMNLCILNYTQLCSSLEEKRHA